jgi:hypothetical protein
MSLSDLTMPSVGPQWEWKFLAYAGKFPEFRLSTATWPMLQRFERCKRVGWPVLPRILRQMTGHRDIAGIVSMIVRELEIGTSEYIEVFMNELVQMCEEDEHHDQAGCLYFNENLEIVSLTEIYDENISLEDVHVKALQFIEQSRPGDAVDEFIRKNSLKFPYPNLPDDAVCGICWESFSIFKIPCRVCPGVGNVAHWLCQDCTSGHLRGILSTWIPGRNVARLGLVCAVCRASINLSV